VLVPWEICTMSVAIEGEHTGVEGERAIEAAVEARFVEEAQVVCGHGRANGGLSMR
jgi:hypothetical protein